MIRLAKHTTDLDNSPLRTITHTHDLSAPLHLKGDKLVWDLQIQNKNYPIRLNLFKLAHIYPGTLRYIKL